MTPNINTSNSLKLNFHSLPSQPQQKVTFDIQENFDHLLLSPPGLGEIQDEEDNATGGWDADEDISTVLKQQRMEERKKRSVEGLLQKKNKEFHLQH